MTNEMDPKWKRFEKAVFEIQKQLSPDSDVKYNDFIKGVDSQALRQIDISVRRHIAQYSILIVIECKDYKKSIDIKVVEEFAGLVKDVRANKGAIISSSGFTESALRYVKAHGIDAFQLIDTESMDWKVYASVPVLLESTNFKRFRIIFKNFTKLPRIIENADVKTLKLFSTDGELMGTIGNIIANKWNNHEIDEMPGEKEVQIGKNISLEIANDHVTPIDIYAQVYVVKNFYYGKLPIHFKGFQDLQNGGVISNELETDAIEPYKIEKGLIEGWEKIDNPEDLSVTPFMRLSVKDHIPVDKL